MMKMRFGFVLVGMMALAACAAPTTEETASSSVSALAGDPDPDLQILLPAVLEGKIDVIIVTRTASSDLAKKIIDAGGKLQLDVGKPGAPVSGELSGKFKLEDLKEILVKKERIIVVVKAGTGGPAAQKVFDGAKDAIDKQAGQTEAPAPPPEPAPAPTPPAPPPSGGMGMDGTDGSGTGGDSSGYYLDGMP
jgi:hypothetical protein